MISARPPATDSGLKRWSMFAAATVVAGFLLFFYVQLLNDSVARGAHWRYSQATTQSGATSAPTAHVQLIRSNR